MPAWVPLNINLYQSRYRALIGVGGIGTGWFFALSGDHTLGREESRLGRFLDRRDYCKLHIIAHYIQTLLGPQFHTLPIGKVGDDESGRRLLDEMGATGMDLRYVQIVPGEQTMSSICFVYPDGTGGNLTSEDSANARVGAGDIVAAESEFVRYRGQGIVLAAPEVALEARHKLLQMGSQYGFYRVLALNSAETRSSLAEQMLEVTDLLAINLDEAAALAGIEADTSPESIVGKVIDRLRLAREGLCISITAGRHGSWAWDGKRLNQTPALAVKAVSTAGAGDAHLAGMIVGMVADLSLAEAQELGTLVAALSITSPHTIHPAIDRVTLGEFAAHVEAKLHQKVRNLSEIQT